MEKYFVARKKRRNGKEEGTEMKNGGGGKKHENMWILYENLHTENCLVKIKT